MKHRSLHTCWLLIATMVAVFTLTACGFHLRGSDGEANIPFKTIYIDLPDTSSLGAELKRNIRSSSGTQTVKDKKGAEAILEVLSETREKVVLSLNSQGRIREYTLNYKLRFRVVSNVSKEFLAPTEIALKRDMSFSESQILAKASEEELLYRDMQSDLVQQLLRRLAAVKPN